MRISKKHIHKKSFQSHLPNIIQEWYSRTKETNMNNKEEWVYVHCWLDDEMDMYVKLPYT